MKKTISSFISLSFMLVFLMIVGTGCALNRGILPITERESHVNTTGVPVQIHKIVDMRHFSLSPREASMPSLKYSNEINNKKITERAVARKRNGYGMALGDILLPEGKTVNGLIKSVAIKALRNRGFRVVSVSDSEYNKAIPVELQIIQFWSWMRPGFFKITLTNRTEVILKSPLFNPSKQLIVSSEAIHSTAGAGTSAWRTIINKGLNVFEENLERKLPAPANKN